jgi:PPOX class probable F420-dependent enzyme
MGKLPHSGNRNDKKERVGMRPPTQEEYAGLVVDLLARRNFATLTTLMPGGLPQTQIVWAQANEDGTLVINTETHRQKAKNLLRDPRAVVMIWEQSNPLIYVEVRGRVIDAVIGERALRHFEDIAVAYTGKPYPAEIPSERIMFSIRPHRYAGFGYDQWSSNAER